MARAECRSSAHTCKNVPKSVISPEEQAVSNSGQQQENIIRPKQSDIFQCTHLALGRGNFQASGDGGCLGIWFPSTAIQAATEAPELSSVKQKVA